MTQFIWNHVFVKVRAVHIWLVSIVINAMWLRTIKRNKCVCICTHITRYRGVVTPATVINQTGMHGTIIVIAIISGIYLGGKLH